MKAAYLLPGCNLPLFQERIAQLNKRAAKLGVPSISFTTALAFVQREYYRLHYSEHPRWYKEGDEVPADYVATGTIREWFNVEVEGTAPKFEGWTFIATLEPLATDEGAVNLLQTVPGETCPAEFRSRIGECDHCRAKRNRKQTFVVRHEDGTHKMVGRQCIKDFLGHLDPHQVASWAEMMTELGSLCESSQDEDWCGGGYREDAFDLGYTLALTVSVISHYGWVSKKAAQENEKLFPTAARVRYVMVRPYKPTPAELKEWEAEVAKCQPTEEHKQDGDASIEWARSFTEQQIIDNNYLANCNAIARTSVVTGKTLGIACSVVSSYQREQSKLKLAAKEAARISDYVGVVGKRAEFEVTVTKLIVTEGSYGSTGIHKMLDNQGNDLTWFASGSTEWLKEGCSYKVKATPKKHEEYKGRKQTIFSRVSVLEVK